MLLLGKGTTLHDVVAVVVVDWHTAQHKVFLGIMKSVCTKFSANNKKGAEKHIFIMLAFFC